MLDVASASIHPVLDIPDHDRFMNPELVNLICTAADPIIEEFGQGAKVRKDLSTRRLYFATYLSREEEISARDRRYPAIVSFAHGTTTPDRGLGVGSFTLAKHDE